MRTENVIGFEGKPKDERTAARCVIFLRSMHIYSGEIYVCAWRKKNRTFMLAPNSIGDNCSRSIPSSFCSSQPMPFAVHTTRCGSPDITIKTTREIYIVWSPNKYPIEPSYIIANRSFLLARFRSVVCSGSTTACHNQSANKLVTRRKWRLAVAVKVARRIKCLQCQE